MGFLYKIKEKCSKPTSYWGLIVLLSFILYQYCFYFLLEGIGRPSLKWFLISSSFLTGVCFLARYAKIIISLFFTYCFWGHLNLLYYRFYKTMIPFSSLQININDLFSLTSSGLFSMRWIDIFLYLPFLFCLLFYCLEHKRKYSLKVTLFNFSLCAVLCCFYIKTSYNSFLLKLDEKFRWEPSRGYFIYGYPFYVLYSLNQNDQYRKLTIDEHKEIDSFLMKKNHPYCKEKISKNIILVIVESLETFPIGMRVNNKEVTPFLNTIVNDSLVFWAPKVKSQIHDGMSSDGQLMLNTGLLPISSGAVCHLLNKNYKALPGILKKMNGFCSTVTLLGHSSGIWNQGDMCQSYHYDKLYSKEDLNTDDAFNLGVSDMSLVNQSIPIIKKLKQPFFVQLITVSSHADFKIPSSKRRINITDAYHPILARYLESINYADDALAVLFNKLKVDGLLKNSVVIITGDHYAFSSFFRNEIKKKNKIPKEDFVPFIVYNSGMSGTYNEVMGQIDIFPTLLDMLKIKSDWYGLGNSILGDNAPEGAMDASFHVVGKPKDISSLRKAWKISDLIIRGNYFNNPH